MSDVSSPSSPANADSDAVASAADESNPTGRKLRRDDRIEVTFTGLDAKGLSIGRVERPEGAYRIRVRGVVPGDRALVRVLRRKRDVVDADLLEILSASPDRIPPACPHVVSCGGCSFQELAYTAQLDYLHRVLVQVLDPLLVGADSAGTCIEPVLPCDDPWHYRNKMDFTFGARRYVEPGEPEGVEAAFGLGLHARGRWNKVLDIHACAIAFRGAGEIVATARTEARSRELVPWDVRTHEGQLRHLVLRRSWATGEILANLVTTEEARDEIDPFVAAVLAAHPEITTFVQNVRSGSAMIARGEFERVLHGSGRIQERLGGIDYEVSANSFFQTNTPQAEKLLEIVLEEAGCTGTERVVDLYCGAGTFSLPLARQARTVKGFELVEEAVVDGRRNAQANGIENVELIAGDLAQTVAHLTESEEPADVCIVDPPRAGLHPNVRAVLAEAAPRRIVHVSCNPKTAVPDLEHLMNAGYALLRVRPIDLFPHTPHLECVFVLERRGA